VATLLQGNLVTVVLVLHRQSTEPQHIALVAVAVVRIQLGVHLALVVKVVEVTVVQAVLLEPQTLEVAVVQPTLLVRLVVQVLFFVGI
jgi:hypothetical protein